MPPGHILKTVEKLTECHTSITNSLKSFSSPFAKVEKVAPFKDPTEIPEITSYWVSIGGSRSIKVVKTEAW